MVACRYGILVLVVEMMGATTTLLYGLNILFDPVHEDLPQDPENPGLTMVSSQRTAIWQIAALHAGHCAQRLKVLNPTAHCGSCLLTMHHLSAYGIKLVRVAPHLRRTRTVHLLFLTFPGIAMHAQRVAIT